MYAIENDKSLGIYDNILGAIGNTPLVRLSKLSELTGAEIYAKAEFLNPGLSMKDRVALNVIETAEKEGKIKPGGTIIEASSGNTGFGLAMVSRIKGYSCIITTTTKASKEKVEQLRALGAKVIVCPGKVASTDPQSYYSVAAQLEKEINNSIWINQYDNGANPKAHYKTTGPEIWRQTKGKITHFVAAVGSGGTISGTGGFLKEQNSDIKVIGVDAYGSVLKKYHETGELDPNEKHSYQIEGVGKKIIPGNIAFQVIDKFVKVDDKNSALRARELFKTEAIFGGYSTGSVIQCIYKIRNEFKKGDFVVVLLPDHGSKYMSKIYSDQWMEDNGYFEETKLIPSLSSYYNNTYKKYYYQRIAKIKELRQRLWTYLRK